MKAQLSFWNRSMSKTFSTYKTFNGTAHYENYVAKMKSLGYTYDEIWTEDETLKSYLRKAFDEAVAKSGTQVLFLRA